MIRKEFLPACLKMKKFPISNMKSKNNSGPLIMNKIVHNIPILNTLLQPILLTDLFDSNKFLINAMIIFNIALYIF